MATLYVTEFKAMNPSPGGWGSQQFLPYPAQPPVAEQTVAIGSSSAASNAFSDLTSYVRVQTDAICSIEFGADPTASATTARLAAGQTEYFAVPVGAAFKIAVISNT